MFVPNERVNFVDSDLLNGEFGRWGEHRQYKQNRREDSNACRYILYKLNLVTISRLQWISL